MNVNFKFTLPGNLIDINDFPGITRSENTIRVLYNKWPYDELFTRLAYSENLWRQQNPAKLNSFYFLHTFGLLATKQRLSLNRYPPEHISSKVWSGYHTHMYRAEYAWNTIAQLGGGSNKQTARHYTHNLSYHKLWDLVKRK